MKRLACFSFGFAFLFLSLSAHAETQTLTIHEGRPVLQAVHKLEEVYALPITYEDPPYMHQSELAADRRTPVSVGEVSVTYEIPPEDASEETRHTLAAVALANLLAGYNSLRGAEMFTETEDDGGFHVIPARYVNKSGDVDTMQSILETPITLALTDQTPQQAIAAICQAAATASGQDLTPGDLQATLQVTKTFSVYASQEPARSVLDRLFADFHVKGTKKVPTPAGAPRREGGNDPNHVWIEVPAHLSWEQLCGGSGSGCLFHVILITPPGAMGGANVAHRHQPLPN